MLVECVVNVSEGRDDDILGQLAAAARPSLLHLHRDPDHNRSVLTLAGPAEAVAEDARSLAGATVARLDLREHTGAHPRLGVLDVVPFVPYEPGHAAPTARPRARTSVRRTSGATRRATSTDETHTLYATSTRRAPTAVAPVRGSGAGGP